MNIDHDHSPHGQVSIGSGSSSDVGSYVQKIMGTSREGSTALCANLAQDLNQLSFQERCAVYEEIHGVDPQLEEKEEVLNSKLAALEDEIARFSIKPAYELSMKMSHVYVTSRKFRLMFLRAESMDPAKAAIRLIKFMELKLQYFGPGSLARPICSSDLDSDDLSTLKAGRLQVLPEKDRSGRAVIGTFLNLTSLLPCKDPASMVRSSKTRPLHISIASLTLSPQSMPGKDTGFLVPFSHRKRRRSAEEGHCSDSLLYWGCVV